MSPANRSTPAREQRSDGVWLAPLLTWIAILVLLGMSAALALAPPGRAKFAVNFVIAGVQVVLVGLFFMRLNRASNLVRLTAVAGFFWLVFLFVLAGADYLTRP